LRPTAVNTAIIVAAGEGRRAGGDKQFRRIAGAPVVVHTLRRFEACASIARVVLVLPASDTARFFASLESYGLKKVVRIVAGGASRTESVWRGLQATSATAASIVAVHDGVRPLVLPTEIDSVVGAAHETGAAILAAPVIDTIKEVDGESRVVRTLPRSGLRRALTPQCFRHDLLRRAYERAMAEGWEETDDSALVERLGVAVRIIEGSARNIKITTPDDFRIAEALLREEMNDRASDSMAYA